MNIYIGNLPFTMDDDGLRDLFSQVGEVVSARVIQDRETNRSRGFGFVEMRSAEDAKNAIQRFNGYNLEGRTLTVNEAKPKGEGGPRGGGGGPRGGGRPSRW